MWRSQHRFTRLARKQAEAESRIRRTFKEREQRIMAGLADSRRLYAAIGVDTAKREATLCHDHLVAFTTALVRHFDLYVARFVPFEDFAFARDYVAELRLTLLMEDICLAALLPEQIAPGYAEEPLPGQGIA